MSTIDNLIRRGMVLPNWCCLCKENVDSVGDTFIHCIWATTFFESFQWVHPMTVKDLLTCWPNHDLDSGMTIGREVWLMVPATICGAIWEERNRRVLENEGRESRQILDDILVRLYGWLFLTQSRVAPPFRNWMFEWDYFLY